MIRLRRRDYLPSEGPPVAVETSRIHGTMPAHAHDFIELAVYTHGRATHGCSAGAAKVAPGTVVVLSPGEWHEYSHAEKLVVRNVYIGSELFSRELEWVRKMPELSALLWPPARTAGTRRLDLGAAAQHRVQKVLDTLEDDRSDRGLSRIGNLLLLLAELAPTPDPALAPIPDAVLRVVDTFESDLTHPWTLSDLAAVAGVSTSTLTRLFRNSLGVPPLASLARLRAERAAALLIETDLPVGEVGAQVGWPDPAYMSRRFTTLMGASPRRYRESTRASS